MNKDLKKFIMKLLLLVVATVIGLVLQLLVGIYIMGNQYQEGYTGAMIDKVARLKSINEPKIILVGDSNLAFSMNSPMLQEAMGMPVVNLGLHAGLGHVFPERAAKFNINSGDIVIVSYYTFTDSGFIANPAFAWYAVEYHKDLWDIVHPEDYLNMLKTWPQYWLSSFSLWITFQGNSDSPPHVIGGVSYLRKSFNECGDVVVKPEEEKELASDLLRLHNIDLPSINSTCINQLNELNRYAQQRGAVVLIAGYPIAYGPKTPPAEAYDRFQKELAQRLDCEVISNYRDYFISYEYCYDYILHLDERGADIRTSQLIKDLEKWKSQKR